MPSKSFFKLIILFLVLSLGPASIAFLYTRTGGLESRREIQFHKTLRYVFMSDSSSIELKQLTNWPWEKACIFDHNINRDKVNFLLGFEYENYNQLTWVHLPDHWTFLFVGKLRDTNWGLHRPVVALRVPKIEIAQYGGPKKGLCITDQNAKLLIKRQKTSINTSPVLVTISN